MMLAPATPRDREACLTAAEVRRLLKYEPDTGTFFWRVDTRNTAAGALREVIGIGHAPASLKSKNL